jgi:uncharacterized SAM-binding protein YcdF (DUF218 family)
MNDLFVMLGIEPWKPTLSALVMPPVPFLLMILVGARLMYRSRALAWSLLLLGCMGTWLMCTTGAGTLLTNGLLMPPRALGPSQIADLKRSPKTAIVVLGAGRYLLAPEYGVSNLRPTTIERLRYAIWLGRETGLPVAYSGGVGHGGDAGPSEAEIAARIAEHEFGRPLRWTEGLSRDTNENAFRSLALMHEQGIERIVLVTHGYHMRRALGAFERAKLRTATAMDMVAAPMGMAPPGPIRAGDWVPTMAGFTMTRIALHEWLGRLLGA